MLIEYYLPDQVLSNETLKMEFPEWDEAAFAEKVGIFERHISGKNETALDMAEKAAQKVLASFDKHLVDFILLCTQSPDYFLPTSACILQSRLGLSESCGALDFNLGCSGYVYGLALAKGLLSAGIAKNILFVASETYSKHIHPGDKTNRSIFGDAAAATIITYDDLHKIGQFNLKTDGKGFPELIVANGGFRNALNPFAEEKSYGTNNIFTSNHLYMNGPEIFNFTIEVVPNLVEDTLLMNNLTKADIDFFVFHQANAFMLNFLRKKIKIPLDKFYIDLSTTGNTVSATVPIALKRSLDEGKIKVGDKVMLAGFGVGLSWGAVIINI